ncbi:FMN-binding negative transcriptional regulator [Actinacidiphila sp. ITFR-21]|uniref:FMN-binding negative transcriptional regulator n=1 Tax=Actinacidiphila sp. ITFR-21 TaxID=3075199 RepID=UPI00288C418F|nr:FMN-binding negative transcriptional regulator [Streptomyces sp. ITFR-21]WNI19358.1 FMN-binding negative transcriptional regulator [Streptomyces sp. ITFR-21]
MNGTAGEPPFVRTTPFLYDPAPGEHGEVTGPGCGRGCRPPAPGEHGEVLPHLARPHPPWHALEASPRVILSVVDDRTFIPGPWHALPDEPTDRGTPTSFHAAVQLLGVAHVLDDPDDKAAQPRRLAARFQPAGGTAPVVPGREPFGRMLAGIRGVRPEVTAGRAKSTFGANRPVAVQCRVAGLLAGRTAPNDAAARAHQPRQPAAREGPPAS